MAARKPGPAFADHGAEALRQSGNEIECVGGAHRGLDLLRRRVRLAESQIVFDGAVEEVRVLPDDGDIGAYRFRIECLQILTADPHSCSPIGDRAGEGAVERLSISRPHSGTDDADAFASLDFEADAVERESAAAGISELHVVEGDERGEWFGWLRPLGEHRHGRFEQCVDADGGGLPDEAVVKDGAEIAQRPENLGSGHQHDQESLDRHRPLRGACDAERERARGADRDAEIDDAARRKISAQDPQRRLVEHLRLVGEHAPVSFALAESFEGCETLDRVEKFRAKGLVGSLPSGASLRDWSG